jgi:hypothetical protein
MRRQVVVQVVEHALKVLVIERSMPDAVVPVRGEILETEVELVDLAGELVVRWREAWSWTCL